MADSPAANSDGPVEILIMSAGSRIGDTINIVSVATRTEMNRVPEAVIIIEDGSIPEQDFPVADSETFKPGAEIDISAGYGDESPAAIFKGVVVAQRLRIRSGKPELIVTCRDKGFKLTLGRRSRVFEETKDSDTITTLASEAGLSANVTATPVLHPKLVQYRCTDWDWIITRAETCGMLASLSDGELTVAKPDLSAGAVLTVTLGVDLVRFDGEVDARTQFTSVAVSAWSIAEQAKAERTASQAGTPRWGNLTSSALAEVGARDRFEMGSAAPLTANELEAIATARQGRSDLARMRGEVRFQGNGKARLWKALELSGLGDRFSGNGLICAVSHEIRAGHWETTVGLGLDPTWRSEAAGGGLGTPAAGGLTAPARGLQIGKVKQLTKDPNSESSVQVEVPLMGDTSATLWARLGGIYASKSAGSFFFPEIGDEVVLGFFDEDPSYPVILGSLYSSVNTSPYNPTEENKTKGLVTPEGLKIEFNDEKKILTLLTPNGNMVVLDDDAQGITFDDQNGNSIVLGSSGITLDSPKDIVIKATGKVSVAATSDLTLSGMNISAEAETTLSAKGQASAEFSASGQVTVKGGIVMIN